MKYAFLIYDPEGNVPAPDVMEKIMDGYGKFTEDVTKSGAMQAAGRLQRTDTAHTVRVRDGKAIATDGPFAETKEQLAGYSIVEAKDLDEVLAIATRHPLVRAGLSIEVRPIRVGPPQ